MLETSGVEAKFSFAGGGVCGGLDGPALVRLLPLLVICSKTGMTQPGLGTSDMRKGQEVLVGGGSWVS